MNKPTTLLHILILSVASLSAQLPQGEEQFAPSISHSRNQASYNFQASYNLQSYEYSYGIDLSNPMGPFSLTGPLIDWSFGDDFVAGPYTITTTQQVITTAQGGHVEMLNLDFLEPVAGTPAPEATLNGSSFHSMIFTVDKLSEIQLSSDYVELTSSDDAIWISSGYVQLLEFDQDPMGGVVLVGQYYTNANGNQQDSFQLEAGKNYELRIGCQYEEFLEEAQISAKDPKYPCNQIIVDWTVQAVQQLSTLSPTK